MDLILIVLLVLLILGSGWGYARWGLYRGFGLHAVLLVVLLVYLLLGHGRL